ncbi:MAG: prenyltransferase [Bacteroidetes bacterium]|nr:MAG: prenyltransferase [Bacteroidota bacterium]
MPVYLFALSQIQLINTTNAIITFCLLHLLVYPASNLFNSYYDRDNGSVGGIKNPPPANSKMLLLANTLDLAAILVSTYIHPEIGVFVTIYIIASRLYSYRPIRLKQYPFIGFLVIFIFQGAFTFYLSAKASYGLNSMTQHLESFCLIGVPIHKYILAMLASSFQIGAIYPLTQIYQHQSDLDDGVTTLSYKLGYRGTFIFSGLMFGISTVFYYLHFKDLDINSFYLLLIVQIPIIAYFVYWASKVWTDTKNADYKHTMQMNVIAAVVLNLFFIYLILT